MNTTDLTTHACEQVLRFTRVAHWNDLTEERKVQLAFNMGVLSLGLGLDKTNGYTAMANARAGVTSIQDLHAHLRHIVATHNVPVSEANIAKPF